MKTIIVNFSAGINAMVDRRLMPDGYAVVMDNVDLRTSSAKPFKLPSFHSTATTNTTRVWEFLGKFYLSDKYRTYAAEVTETQRRVYFAEEGPGHSIPQKIVNDIQAQLGTLVPEAPLTVGNGYSTTPTDLTLTASFSGLLNTGVQYGYRVSAKTTDGTLVPCAEVTVLVSEPGTSSTSHNRGSVLLLWGAVSNAVSYTVFGRTPGSEQVLADDWSSTSYFDDGTKSPSGAYASTFDVTNPYQYVYTYVRSVGSMEDESGPSPLSVSLTTSNGRILTRVPSSDGFYSGANAYTTSITAATSWNSTIYGAIYNNHCTYLTLNTSGTSTGAPLGPWFDEGWVNLSASTSTDARGFQFTHLSALLATPSAPVAAAGGAGGTLGAGTYIYKVAAIVGYYGAYGSAGFSATQPATTAASSVSNGLTIAANNKITVTWTGVLNANGYQVFRSGDAGATWQLINTASAATVAYTDDGTNQATGVTPPTFDSSQYRVLVIKNIDLSGLTGTGGWSSGVGGWTAYLSKYLMTLGTAQTIRDGDAIQLSTSTTSAVYGAQLYKVAAVGATNINVSNPASAAFDQHTCFSGDFILLINQTAPAENGFWRFNGVGVALTRPYFYQSGQTVTAASVGSIWVEFGAVYASIAPNYQMLAITTGGTITVGTTGVSFTTTTTTSEFLIDYPAPGTLTPTKIQWFPSNNYFTYWRVYRTGDTTSFLKVADIPITESSYTDTLPTTALGGTIPSSYVENGVTVNYAVPNTNLQGLELHNGMVFGHIGNVLRWTPIGVPDAWPDNFSLTFSYPILAKASFASGLIVLCQDGLYRLDGFTPTSLSLQKTLIEDGLIAPRSVQKTSHGLIYLARRGVMLTDGNTAICMTDKRLPYNFLIQPGTYTEPYSQQTFWWYTTDHTVNYASLAYDTNSPTSALNTISATIQADVPQTGPVYAARSFIYRDKYFLFYSSAEADYLANTAVCIDLATEGYPITTLGAKLIDAHVTALDEAYVLVANDGAPATTSTSAYGTYTTTNNNAGGFDIDGSGNLYLAANNAIWKIPSGGGAATAIAGVAGTSGHTDGTGSTARFGVILDCKFGTDGFLYVPETGVTSYVRKVSTAGVVTTVATMPAGFGSGDGIAINPSNNDIYVADSTKAVIWKVAAGTASIVAGSTGFHGWIDGTGTAAAFYTPIGMAFKSDGSVMYICDQGNFQIRAMTVPGYVVSTPVGATPPASGDVDGTGNSVRLTAPSYIYRHANTAVYFVDRIDATTNKIKLMNPTGYTVTTASTRTDITSPVEVYGVAVDTAGDIFYSTDAGVVYEIAIVPASQPSVTNVLSFVNHQAQFNSTFAPSTTAGSNSVYRWEGSDQRVPMFIRTGEFNAGLPAARKLWQAVNFHGDGTASVRVYLDGTLISQQTLVAQERWDKPRRLNLPLGTKGYGLAIEVCGDYNLRAVTIEYEVMPNSGDN